jgi:hypothetical protein
VLLRVVRILAAFTPEASALTVTAIARRAALPQATASRLVAEMIGHGLLDREPGGRVRIDVRLWELAQRAAPTLRLREAAMPFMQDLHNVVGHHVQLGVLDGDEVLFSNGCPPPRGSSTSPGSRAGCRCTPRPRGWCRLHGRVERGENPGQVGVCDREHRAQPQQATGQPQHQHGGGAGDLNRCGDPVHPPSMSLLPSPAPRVPPTR